MTTDNTPDMLALIERVERELAGGNPYPEVDPADLRAMIEALKSAAKMREAGQSVIDQAFDHYTARNGKRMSIEGDDGEKCWIVPFDAFEELRAALANGGNA